MFIPIEIMVRFYIFYIVIALSFFLVPLQAYSYFAEDEWELSDSPKISTHLQPMPFQIADSLDWDRPRFDEREQEREYLVQTWIIGQGITDPNVIDAMLQVPRHKFIPEEYQRQAYQNTTLPIGFDQNISEPYIVALMAEMLEIKPGDKVLNIGTGSGYNAAVLSELTPHVYTIEILEPLGLRAAELFDELGYHTIEARIGDGYNGWKEHAPFDKIIVTAAADNIPQPLIDQLNTGGIIAIPVGRKDQAQVLTRLIKDGNGNLRTERVLPVRFVPLSRSNGE
jgi:protein-L-isoaspartate(D-aspartate) O-methyltransferase